MRMPNSQEILLVERDRVAAFIEKHAHAKTLSKIVRNLNTDLMNGDERASDMAARALHHLGFVQDA